MKVLFVCLGNICRSPLAEALFIHHLKEQGLSQIFRADSCGTSSLHQGDLADKRTRANASEHGIEITHRSRPFVVEDFEIFDLIVVMDESNYTNIEKLSLSSEHLEKVVFLRDFDLELSEEDDIDVPDPWFGGDEGFEEVYQMIDRCILELINTLKPEENEINS